MVLRLLQVALLEGEEKMPVLAVGTNLSEGLQLDNRSGEHLEGKRMY